MAIPGSSFECCTPFQNQNQNSLLVIRQIYNPSPGAVTGENKSLALTREVNLDTLSSNSSEEEIRDSGRSFQSLIVWGKKLYIRGLLFKFVDFPHCSFNTAFISYLRRYYKEVKSPCFNNAYF